MPIDAFSLPFNVPYQHVYNFTGWGDVLCQTDGMLTGPCGEAGKIFKSKRTIDRLGLRYLPHAIDQAGTYLSSNALETLE